MKKLTSATLLVAGAIMASLSAKAQFTANDLYLGFENDSASSDYIIDLGQASTIVGGSSAVDLSDDFSLADFNIVLGASSANMMGVVGGINQFPSSYDVYATALRSGGAGDPAVAGSDLSLSLTLNHTAIGEAVGAIAVIDAPTAGSSVLDSSKSWYNNIEPVNNAGTFYGATGVETSSAVGGSGVLYEDLWEETATASSPGTPAYLGYFTLDLSGDNPSLTFTPSAAPIPEPSAGLISCAGLSLLWLRRRFSGATK